MLSLNLDNILTQASNLTLNLVAHQKELNNKFKKFSSKDCEFIPCFTTTSSDFILLKGLFINSVKHSFVGLFLSFLIILIYNCINLLFYNNIL